MAEIYFSGQGKVYVASRSGSGAPQAFRDLGNVPALQITLETDVMEHKESRTGQRLTDLRITRERSARVTMTLESWTKANLMMLLYGTSSTANSGTVTTETFPSGLVAGDIVRLQHPYVSSVVLTDSATPPVTVTSTDYSVDAASGMVTILDLNSGATPPAAYTQPLKAAYSYGAKELVPMFREPYKERFLRFVGLNTANEDKPVIVELYRVVFDPAGNLDLITDEMAQFAVEGSVLYDSGYDSDSALGGFGRIIQDSF